MCAPMAQLNIIICAGHLIFTTNLQFTLMRKLEFGEVREIAHDFTVKELWNQDSNTVLTIKFFALSQ